MSFVDALGVPGSGLILCFAHIMSSLEAIEVAESGLCACITHIMPSIDTIEAPGTGLCTQTALILSYKIIHRCYRSLWECFIPMLSTYNGIHI